MTSAASQPAPAPAASPPGQEGKPSSLGWRILRVFLYQRELTPLVILVALFIYFALRAGSDFTGLTSLSSAAGYAGPIGAIAVGQVLLLVLGGDRSVGRPDLPLLPVGRVLAAQQRPPVRALRRSPAPACDRDRTARRLPRRCHQRPDHRDAQCAVVRYHAGDELHPVRRGAGRLTGRRGEPNPAERQIRLHQQRDG